MTHPKISYDEAVNTYHAVSRRFHQNQIPGADWAACKWSQTDDGYWQRVATTQTRLVVKEDHVILDVKGNPKLVRIDVPDTDVIHGVPVEYLDR